MAYSNTSTSQLLTSLQINKESEPRSTEVPSNFETGEIKVYSPQELQKLLEAYNEAQPVTLFLTSKWQLVTQKEFVESNSKLQLIGRCEFRRFKNEKNPTEEFLLTGVEADFNRYGRPLEEIKAYFFEFMRRWLNVQPFPICSFESKSYGEVFFTPLSPLQIQPVAIRPGFSNN